MTETGTSSAANVKKNIRSAVEVSDRVIFIPWTCQECHHFSWSNGYAEKFVMLNAVTRLEWEPNQGASPDFDPDRHSHVGTNKLQLTPEIF